MAVKVSTRFAAMSRWAAPSTAALVSEVPGGAW